jgi:TetR/AcrR family transcriptional repressor of nem operon
MAVTAISNVMKATKKAKNGLYGHFESTEDLSRVVVNYNISLLIAKVGQAVGSVHTAKDMLFVPRSIRCTDAISG